MTRTRDLLTTIIVLARLIRTEADRRARAHGMTRAQWAMLIRIAEQPGILQKELAELLEVEPITVARLVDRLEARAMVERRADPGDRRCWRLHLTEAARPLLGHVEAQLTDMADLLCQDVSPTELATLADGLSELRDRAQVLRAALPAAAEPTCREVA